jgi:hypothetical protein
VIVAATLDAATLRDAMNLLCVLFPDRLVILDSAWKSAADVEKFKAPRKAFELLHRLCTTYWECLAKGKSDAEARMCFGNNSFSAKESETVENNKKARKLRTFVYEGKPYEMMMHLKIGNKPSVSETFRAHFHWDPTNRVLVLGHCGKHLDHS